MNKSYYRLLIFCIGIILLSRSIYAYIDPGTGGVIAGSLWPLIVAFLTAILAFLIKYFWMPLKKIASKFKK